MDGGREKTVDVCVTVEEAIGRGKKENKRRSGGVLVV